MAFADPRGNVEQLGLVEGMQIADLGAGTGAYSIPMAEKVGTTGRVYAVEVQKELLQNIKTNADNVGVRNIELLWGDIERLGGTKIADQSVDYVVIANVIFQLDDVNGCISEVKRILRKNGRLLLVDWKDSFDGIGPTADRIVKPDEARRIFEEAGFTFDRAIDTGSQHYGFVVVNT